MVFFLAGGKWVVKQGWAGEHHLDGMKRNLSDGKHGDRIIMV